MNVTLLIPTLNEIEGLKAIMPRINPAWCDQILFVDGRSTDGTAEYLREHHYEYVVQRGPVSLFQAYRDAYPLIRGDVVIAFSPDGNSVPEAIPQLIQKMKEGNYDLVVASRYMPGVRSADDTWYSAFGNALFTCLINFLFGGRYTDAMVMYRAFRKSLLEELGLLSDPPFSLERLFSGTVCLVPLMAMRAAKKKLSIAEIPAAEPARIGGVAKCRHFVWGTIYLLEMVQERLIWNFKPTRVSANPSTSGSGS